MKEEIFAKIRDPRVMGRCWHTLEDVMRIALIGVLCACDDYEEIYDFVCERKDDLIDKGFLELPYGVPSPDTIRRVVERVNPEQLRLCFAHSRQTIADSLRGLHISIDGKKLRGENPTSRGCNGLYILNAFVNEHQICIGETRVEDKTNEAKALPKALAQLNLTGALVSVDAMGTHRNIASQIKLQGGDYLMCLKDNQPTLNELVDSVFAHNRPMSVFTSENKGHGRTETRTCSLLDTRALEQEGMYQEWPGLKRVIKMERSRMENGHKSKETVYYITSEDNNDAEYYANRIREHWGVENRLHWHLDVTFKEDQCRVRTGFGAENLSSLRKYALELLKSQKDKLSLKRRRKKCMLNLDYLTEVVIGS